MLDEIKNTIRQINRGSYKKLSEIYKTAMNNGDDTALGKYSELLQLAKKHNIK